MAAFDILRIVRGVSGSPGILTISPVMGTPCAIFAKGPPWIIASVCAYI